VRTETGRQIRNAFTVPAATSVLLAADYSQIELRVLAHLSEDPALTRAFENDEDIHAATASEVMNVPISEVTSDMRRIAKMVNFGLAYGLTKFGLAQRLEISRAEAGNFVDTYFDRYSGVRDYIETTKDQARTYGYVQTAMGRRRYIPDIKASNRQVREAAERMAVNMPVQGPAADILKVAMVRLDDQIQSLAIKTRMILQIHDELIFEVPEVEVNQVMNLVQEIMPEAMSLKVPLKVDVKTGSSWGGLE
jgi:DNA polymerase-1